MKTCFKSEIRITQKVGSFDLKIYNCINMALKKIKDLEA